jgi:ABC-type branched-subunit amino acid transport system substrate-binding protein
MINAKTLPWLHKPAFLLLQLILIFVYGCSPKLTDTVIVFPTDTITPPSAIAQEQPTATQSPATATLTPFVPKAVFKIFIHGPLSGDQRSSGLEMMRSAELAVQQLSGPLSEQSYKVELVPYDDQDTVETALANARQVIADPDTLCGIGHYDFEITMAASEVYHEGALAFIAPTITDPLLTDRLYLEVNRLVGRADRQGYAAAQFAKAKGFQTVFIVSQNSGNSVRNAEYFRIETGSFGIKWLGSVFETVNEQNMDQVVSRIVNAKPELIYISTSAQQAVPLLTELRAAGYTGSFLGTERLDSQSTISDAGASLVQGGGLYYTITDAPLNYYAGAAAFVQDFQTQYGLTPHSLAARVYDATGICLKAIEEASQAKGGTPPTRAEVARAIRALKDYQGITGMYNFNNHGDPSPSQYYVYQVVSTDNLNWDQNPIIASYDITPP